MKRTPFKRKPNSFPSLKRTKIRVKGKSDYSQRREEIQELLREIVIIRDGGCWLRHYPQAGACGGYTKAGKLILQAEHLRSRASAISFADPRLVLCCCMHHHIFWKPQNSDLYNELAESFIGQERTELWKNVRNDHSAYHLDWALEIVALKQHRDELIKLKDLKDTV